MDGGGGGSMSMKDSLAMALLAGGSEGEEDGVVAVTRENSEGTNDYGIYTWAQLGLLWCGQ